MAKNDTTDFKDDAPLVPEPTVDPAPDTEQKAAETVVETSADPRDNPTVADEQAPDVQVVLSEDYVKQIEALDGDDPGVGDGVYVQVAELPEDLGENDRFKVPTTPTAVPAAVAAQLVESPAVEVAE